MTCAAQNFGRCIAFAVVLFALSVGRAQQSNAVPEYRSLTKADGLTCHLYEQFSANPAGIYATNPNTGGQKLQCSDSKRSKALRLMSIQKLDNGKTAIMTKDFGTIYYKNEETCLPSKTEAGKPAKRCTDHEAYEMTEYQIRQLKLFLSM